MGDKKKYALFHVDGGIGKHVAATAVARCIKNNYPDRELIVICAWPLPFINLDFVDRVYKTGVTPYFYQDYVLEQDSLLFKHEPYFTTAHIHKQKSLIENWCELYNLEYKRETPELVFNLREKQLIQNFWESKKPILLLHTAGGLYEQKEAQPYKWTRDMPVGVIQKIVDEFREEYDIFQVTRPGAPTVRGVTVVDKPFSVMELATLVARSTKRVFIDSALQHVAAAIKLPSTVLWIGTDSVIFGYKMHDNIVANKIKDFKLPDSYLFDYSFDGQIHECPYKDEGEMFDAEQIITSIRKQGQ